MAGDAQTGRSLADQWLRHYQARTIEIRAFPGVPAMLTALRKANVRTAVVTNKTRERYMEDALESGLLELTDLAVCAGDAAANKPDPAPIRYALGRLGVEADSAMMAGDTPVDVAAGTAAGVPVVAVAWGAVPAPALLSAGATAVARDPEELTELVLQRTHLAPKIAQPVRRK